MHEYPEVAVVIDSIKARAPVDALKNQLTDEYGPTFATRENHSCARAAVLNSISAACDNDTAEICEQILKLRTLEIAVTNLRQLSSMYHEIGAGIIGFELRKCPKYARSQLEKKHGKALIKNYRPFVKTDTNKERRTA